MRSITSALAGIDFTASLAIRASAMRAMRAMSQRSAQTEAAMKLRA